MALTVMAGAAAAAAAVSPAPSGLTLAGSVPAFVGHARAVGDVPGRTRLSVQLWLRPEIAAAARYAQAGSSPSTPAFRHYLSPDAYTARFGPAASQVGVVESWLRGQGFAPVRADAGRDYVRATAAVTTIDKALRTTLMLYRPSAQASVGGYTAGQLRGAYGMDSTSTGKGQTVALVEVGLVPQTCSSPCPTSRRPSTCPRHRRSATRRSRSAAAASAATSMSKSSSTWRSPTPWPQRPTRS